MLAGFASDKFQINYPVLRFAVPPDGVEIRYTLDGTRPTSSSPLFPDSLRIDTSCVLQARGVRRGSEPGPIVRYEYRLRAPAVRLTWTRGHVAWSSTRQAFVFEDERVAIGLGPYADESYSSGYLSGLEPIDIRYTCDGTDPTRASTAYRDSLSIDSSCLLQARSFRPGMEPGPILRYEFVAPSPPSDVPVPRYLRVVQNRPGTYHAFPVIKIQTWIPGAEIHYTTDGSIPTPASPVYRDSLRIESSCLVQAIAFAPGVEPSELLSARYTLQVPAVQAEGVVGESYMYDQHPVVRLSMPLDSVEIRYTLDSTLPTRTSPLYRDSLPIDTSCILTAIGFRRGMFPSTPLLLPIRPRASRPRTTVAPGVYDHYLDVALRTMAPEGQIRYTLDGSPVLASSPLYVPGVPIRIDNPVVTMKARTFAKGLEPSEEVEWVYQLQVATMSVAGDWGTLWEGSAFRVGLACETPGVEIRYTTDGSEPTATSLLYTDSLLITSAVRDLRARTFTPSQPALAPAPDVVLHWDWLGMGMKMIPAGSFQSQGRTIQVQAFLMDSTEVVQGSFQELMGWNPSYWTSWGPGSVHHPVDRVTWNDAIRYCNARSKRFGLDTVYTYRFSGAKAAARLFQRPASETVYDEELADVAADFSKNGYRLPTEAEWVHAMRAGSGERFHWGGDSSFDVGRPFAWFGTGWSHGTLAVGRLEPNAWGMYDMVGNVQEWVHDWYGETEFGNGDVDPRGPETGNFHMSRGGGILPYQWSYDENPYAFDPRLPRGNPSSDDVKRSEIGDELGFRCVRRP